MSELPEPDPVKAARRRTRRRRLIPEEAACVHCGEADPDLLEDDHPLGWQMADGVRVWLCKNCHARQTADRYDHQAGPPPGRQRQQLARSETLARALRALAVFFHVLAHALFGFADWLVGFTDGLDRFAPGWRTQPWAL